MNWNSSTALGALRSSDLLDLGMSANQVRRKLHPEAVVTYELCGRTTSLEQAARDGLPHAEANVYLDSIRDIESVSLDTLRARLLALREQLPAITFHHLPISRLSKAGGGILALVEAFPTLVAVGLRSITADFDPASNSFSCAELSRTLSAATSSGLFVSVSITIGNSESLEQRIATLEMLRGLQQDFHSIQVVRVRVHHAAAPEARREEEATAVDYLRTLAVTRIFLENVEHLQTDWSVMGPKVLELALRFGADDAGRVPWSQTGNPEPSHHGGESELRRIIRDAGFRPVERDAFFRQSLLR